MRTFSELTGLSPSILRAWERRHGLLRPTTTEGGHRLYTDEDLRVMRRVSLMLEQGRVIGEIAALGRESLLRPEAASKPAPAPRPPDTLRGLEGAIVESARSLDGTLLARTLDRAFALFSVETVLSQIVQPATAAIGVGWATGEISVAGEHMVSAALTARIQPLWHAAQTTNPNAPLVICACLPGEQHELGLFVLALHLSSAGYRVAYLGRDLPLDELKAAAERLGARAVCLSSLRRDIIDAAKVQLAALARTWRGKTRVHLGYLEASELRELRDLEEAGLLLWGPGFELVTLYRELISSS